MRLHFATNVISDPEELWLFGDRRVLASYAYLNGGGFESKARRNYDGFWLASQADRNARVQEWQRLYFAGNVVERDDEMRLYFAGNVKPSAGDDAHRVTAADGVRNRLLTFADIDDWAREGFNFWMGEQPENANVFLDSGAFGAYTRGAVIDLGRYCDYILEHESALACYAALDVIKDWRGTQRNLDLMLARGLRPVPCFHRGSPWEVLDEVVSTHPYIALGGLVGGSPGSAKHDSLTVESLSPYLDECFRRLERHWPVKVHIFGVVAQWVLERYPFYSADSASAIMGAGMGRVQRFSGRDMALRSRGWADDVEATWDGEVADGVGRVAAADGKSASAHAGRRRRNIEAVLRLEREITELWDARGIKWDA